MIVVRKAAMVLVGATILIAGIGLTGYADTKTVLFSGSLQGADLGGWGSGTIAVDEEETYLDENVLRVETTGFYEGGRLELKPPLDADTYLSDPAGGYLRLVVKVHEPQPPTPTTPEGGVMPGGAMPMPGEPGLFPPPVEPGGAPMPAEPGLMAPPGEPMPPEAIPPEAMPPEAMPPEAMPPGEIMMGPPGLEGAGPVGTVGTPTAPPPKISQLRVLLVTDKGALDSGPIVLSDYAEIVEDWVQIVIPLSRFKGTADVSGGEIQHVALFGDVEETFWVGELELGYEEQPLIADAGENITTTVDTITRFEAAPQPEGVKASYVWDFDDLDGIQEEGYGQETTWTFLTPGYYVVTLTVKDPDGKRVDRVDRIHVKVTE